MARLNKARLDHYFAIKTKAAKLDRQSRTLRTEAAQIEQEAGTELTDSGKDSIRRGGYPIQWTEGRLCISWKDELIKEIGAKRVSEIEAKAERPRKVSISPNKAA